MDTTHSIQHSTSDFSVLTASQNDLNLLIQAIYRCSMQVDFPNDFLKLLCQLKNFRSCVVTLIEQSTSEIKGVWDWGNNNGETDAIFHENTYQDDPLFATVMNSEPNRFYASNIEIPEWRNTVKPEFLQWSQSHDINEACAAAILLSDELAFSVFVQRTAAQKGFTEADVIFLNQLIPHIREAMHIHQELCRARQENIEAPAIIDSLPLPTLIINQSFDVSLCNQKAIDWMEKTGLASISNQQLLLSDLNQKNQLSYETSQLINNIGTQELVDDTHIKVIHWPVNNQRITFVIKPIIQKDADNRLIKGAICFIHHPQHSFAVSRQALQKVFELSEREADICELLLQGYDSTEISEMLSLSKHTVRDTIKKRIFKKCNCNSQNELIALLLSSPAAFIE